MRKNVILGAAVVGMLITACLVFCPSKAQSAVETGAKAPNFTLPNSNDEDTTLSDFAGSYVVLEWINHECPFVVKHYGSGNMQSLQEEFTDKGVIWLSINSSAPGKQGHCTGAEANDLTEQKEASPTAVLLDPDGTVGKMYGAKTTPHMFIIDPDGKIIYQGAIDDIPSFDPADIAQANNYVRLALGESMAGSAVSNPSTKSYGCSVKY